MPFSAVGVDTLTITLDNQHKYILLVTCLVTRAVTLELLQSLKTKDLHYTFRNLKARRNTPDLYYSDNAPQFKILEQFAKTVSGKPINNMVIHSSRR